MAEEKIAAEDPREEILPETSLWFLCSSF